MKSVIVKLKPLALLLAVALTIASLAATQSNSHPPFDRKLTKKEDDWVRKTLRAMTLDEKIGQMVMADANITFWNRESEDYKKLEHHIRDNKVGGVLVFRSEVWPTAVLTNRWQEMARTPLLISSDLEMGMGMRFDDTPWWPPNMAVAATGDPKWARLQGEATALQARAMGVNWLFAPTVDVNNNPDNPVINVRSYGEDPQMVAEFGKAFIEGAQGAGAMACAKHFPGHGDTATDSHIGLPVVDVSRERLDSLELIPFRAAIAARAGGVMSAHIALPQIEPEPVAPLRQLNEREASAAEFLSRTEVDAPKVTLPATLSPKVLTGILREDLKFNGVIVTDAMSMAGVAARYTPGESAVRAIEAGADVIEKLPDIDAGIAGIKDAVAKGEIAETRINASVERILRAKAALGLNARRTVDLNEVDRVVNDPKLLEIARQIAEHSLTLVRDEKKLLPLKFGNAKGRLLNITFTDEDDRAITKPFVDELRARTEKVESFTLDLKSTEAEIDRALSRVRAEPFDAVIYSVAVRARSGKGSVALPQTGARIAERLIVSKTPLVVISFGNPYMLSSMADSPSYLLAYSPFPYSQRAVVRALFGEVEIGGKLPVTLPNLYPRGHGLKIDRIGQTAGGAKYGVNDVSYRLFYCDLQSAHFHTVTGFLHAILNKFGASTEAIKDGDKLDRKLVAFSDQIDGLVGAGDRIVPCLDEFEVSFKHPEEFPEDFFDHFRSELSQGRFAFVTSTRRPLKDLCLEGNMTSPFYNVFTSIELKEFSEREAHAFVAAYHQRVEFTDSELKFIFSYLDPHPLKLRILCDWVLKNREKQSADWALAEDVAREYENFFVGKFDAIQLLRAKSFFNPDNVKKLLDTLKTGRETFSGSGKD
jgi:beta-N-acetylhexosaminidase